MKYPSTRCLYVKTLVTCTKLYRYTAHIVLDLTILVRYKNNRKQKEDMMQWKRRQNGWCDAIMMTLLTWSWYWCWRQWFNLRKEKLSHLHQIGLTFIEWTCVAWENGFRGCLQYVSHSMIVKVISYFWAHFHYSLHTEWLNIFQIYFWKS